MHINYQNFTLTAVKYNTAADLQYLFCVLLLFYLFLA
jgi:hypothetical protein